MQTVCSTTGTPRPSHLVASATGAGTTVNSNPRTPAATRDSDALDSTAADLPLATGICTTHTLSALASGLRAELVVTQTQTSMTSSTVNFQVEDRAPAGQSQDLPQQAATAATFHVQHAGTLQRRWGSKLLRLQAWFSPQCGWHPGPVQWLAYAIKLPV